MTVLGKKRPQPFGSSATRGGRRRGAYPASGYTGITKHPHGGWTVKVRCVYVGYFSTLEEALIARNRILRRP